MFFFVPLGIFFRYLLIIYLSTNNYGTYFSLFNYLFRYLLWTSNNFLVVVIDSGIFWHIIHYNYKMKTKKKFLDSLIVWEVSETNKYWTNVIVFILLKNLKELFLDHFVVTLPENSHPKFNKKNYLCIQF